MSSIVTTIKDLDPEMSEGKQAACDIDRCISIAMSVVLIALVAWDILDTEHSIETVHVIILALALLPWVGRFLNSLKLSSSGFEAQF